MEGLEVSVVRLSAIDEFNESLRLDAEFFGKFPLHVVSRVKASSHSSVSKIVRKIQHPIEVTREYEDEGLLTIMAGNVRDNFVSLDDQRFMPEAVRSIVAKNRLKFGDVLMTRTGANFGNTAPWKHGELEAFACADVLVFREPSIPSGYLSSYLSSKAGQALIIRGGYGMAQPHIAPSYLQNMIVPRFDDLEQIVDKLVDQSNDLGRTAAASLAEAEATLLAALGLAGWSPPEPLSYTARAADALSAARLDAQYFRPKYDEALALLTAKGNAAELGTLVKLNSRGRQPIYADAGLPVINSKHVRTNTVNLGEDNRFGETGRSPIVIKPGDVLLNGTGVGTIGRAAPYLFDHDALPDNHVTVIRPDGIDPIYLSVFLNSTLGQLQIEQLIKGSSGQIELYPDDIAKIIVWDAPDGVQTVVRDAVLSAKALEARSRALLASAKRAVEIAIEDGEAVALAFLNASSL